eukprot:scaffold17644_cov54-Phaeocystis_antarctica.AAC.3
MSVTSPSTGRGHSERATFIPGAASRCTALSRRARLLRAVHRLAAPPADPPADPPLAARRGALERRGELAAIVVVVVVAPLLWRLWRLWRLVTGAGRGCWRVRSERAAFIPPAPCAWAGEGVAAAAVAAVAAVAREPEFAFGLQQQVQVLDGAERARMTIAEGLAPHLQRLAAQRLGSGEVALGMQQRAEVVDRA